MVAKKVSNIEESKSSQLRKHYYLDDYVVISPRRSKRPQELSSEILSQKNSKQHPIEKNRSIYEVKERKNKLQVRRKWEVKVVENEYPAFTPKNPDAAGIQEIVLETPKMNTPFSALSVTEIVRVLEVYQRRVKLLRKKYSYISVFKNQGFRSGASLNHTHSQIIASKIIPPQVLRERKALSQYQIEHRTSALCDVIRWELKQEKRVVAHTRHTTTICPFASKFPLETWIIPNRQVHSIIDLTDEEIKSLADHLKGVVSALSDGQIDFNYHLQEGVNGDYNHFFIKVSPRINIAGGYELNTGIYINQVSPEYASRWYRKYIKTP
ncbi:MAG: galactose-1-phosphate uridylyltransferase [Candidatus Saccharimonadales bacterium]